MSGEHGSPVPSPHRPHRPHLRRTVRRVVGWAFQLGALGLVVAVLFVLALVGMLGLVSTMIGGEDAAACPSAEQVPAPARAARAGIPVNYLALYQQAAEQYDVPWAVLAGIGKIETNHGRSTLPGVRSGFNDNGCCAGPMQFNTHDGSPSTWERYHVDGNGDGKYDIYDPRDAIPSAANYVRTLLRRQGGAARKALLGYNNSPAYVADVLRWAATYTGARLVEKLSPLAILDTGTAEDVGMGLGCLAAAGAAAGLADVQSAVRLTQPRAYRMLPQWAMAGDRAPQPVDARLYDDMIWVLQSYHLAVTGAREPGHKTHGDGTALDLVPADGRTQAVWDASAGRAARDLGWTPSCAYSGSRGPCPLVPALHWIGYDGYDGHGSPRTCSAGAGCYAHLHLSWDSPCYGTGTPSPPCSSVVAFRAPMTTKVPTGSRPPAA